MIVWLGDFVRQQDFAVKLQEPRLLDSSRNQDNPVANANKLDLKAALGVGGYTLPATKGPTSLALAWEVKVQKLRCSSSASDLQDVTQMAALQPMEGVSLP